MLCNLICRGLHFFVCLQLEKPVDEVPSLVEQVCEFLYVFYCFILICVVYLLIIVEYTKNQHCSAK